MTTHTKDLLADELLKLDLLEMAKLAVTGYYHDFLSPLATPELQLCEDLLAAARARMPNATADAIMQLRSRVMNGDFDASAEESDEWAVSPEGQDAFHNLIKGS